MDEVSRGGAAGTAEVRPIRPDDAPMIAQLVERCYADGYHKDVMYRPDELAGMIRSGSHSGVVAEAEGTVVGHMAYLWPNENATVVEAGITVVDPGWRGKGIMGRLAVAMGEMLTAGGAIGFVHYPTTAHEVMQRASLSSGGRETGIMLAFLPPETRDRAIAEPGDHRVAGPHHSACWTGSLRSDSAMTCSIWSTTSSATVCGAAGASSTTWFACCSLISTTSSANASDSSRV